MYEIVQADLTAWTPELEKYHALVSDPPYELWFMGHGWDKSGLPFSVEFWERMKSGLMPGAFCMAFSSTRTAHRMMVAIEDAGFVIHPMIGWAFGSGFPKATRIKNDERFSTYRYGLQAMKPAFEPIVVFQKPYRGRPCDCITATGAGALNIEGERVGDMEAWSNPAQTRVIQNRSMAGANYPRPEKTSLPGRWPANLVLQGDAAGMIDKQSGTSYSRRSSKTTKTRERRSGFHMTNGESKYSDSCGASRFFYNVNENLDSADLLYYCGKASASERDAGLAGQVTSRNHHPTCKPIDLIRHLSALLLPPKEYAPRKILVPFSGSGSEMIGCHIAGWDEITGIERETEYIEIARARLEHWTAQADLF